ncbi:MAG: orotidine-5'-phosphate decarboxylase [Polyangia bacterium]|jgi:orotidine-5'-phosphate decarboxylase|nr:orotidine-5'-phosphate decarboxylase [Polyangia bacterium]
MSGAAPVAGSPEARERLIFALDVPDATKAAWFASLLANEVGYFKVGLELFAAAGPSIVREMVERGARVFLDLKLHDIPETVGRTVAVLGSLGVSLLTVHTAGGPAMLREAQRAAQAAPTPIRLLGVTALTSLDGADLRAVGVDLTVRDLVMKRAALARDQGLGGVVTSVSEAEAVRLMAPEPFFVVTPGIRPAGAEAGDQKRTGTPAAALGAGASHLVVGRPIRDAADPAEAARAIVAEMAEALRGRSPV